MDIKGTTQGLDNGKDRSRNAEYPFEVACRLVNMYSAKERYYFKIKNNRANCKTPHLRKKRKLIYNS